MSGWHVDQSVLERYAAGGADGATAASVETHLIACAACRTRLAPSVDTARLANVWAEVRDGIDRRGTIVERLLTRLGVADHVARLVAATPALQRSWLLANAIGVAFAVFAARSGPTPRPVLFLILAPLIPLAGIAFAFGPAIDPTYEVALAAPMRGIRVLLVRAGAVLVTTIAIVGVGSLWVPGAGLRAAAWLVPALAITLAALALSSWFDPAWSAAGVAFAWFALTIVNASLQRELPALERFVAFRASGQIVLAVIAAGAAAVIAARAGRFDLGRNV